MQKILSTILLFLLVHQLYAQPGFQWGKRGGTTAYSPGNPNYQGQYLELVTDAKGNVYALAALNRGERANIDGHISFDRDNQLSLTKWSCDGTQQWTRFMGGSGSIDMVGSALAIDSLGGLYFTGSYQTVYAGGFIYFEGGDTLKNTKQMWYIAKYDTAGVFQWVKTPQADTVTFGKMATANKSGAMGLEADAKGNIYILAHLAPGIFSNAYVSDSLNSFRLMRYDKDGNFLDAKAVEISVSINASNVPRTVNLAGADFGFARDPHSGNFYLSGTYIAGDGDLSFGGTKIIDSGGILILYLAAFDSLGQTLWVEQSSPKGTINVMWTRPRIDESGNVYISGGAWSGTSFMGHTFMNTHPLSGGGPTFVLSIDNTGSLRWGRNSTIYPISMLLRGLTYADGIVYASDNWGKLLTWGIDTLANTANNIGIHLSKFNATTGAPLPIGKDTLRATMLATGVVDLAADKRGNVYIGGALTDSIYLPGGGYIKNSGGGTNSPDFFVIKYGPANCNCSLPVSDFSYQARSGGASIDFTYIGTTPVDSVIWDFGDGSRGVGLSVSHTYAAAGTYNVTAQAYDECGTAVQYKAIEINPTGIKSLAKATAVNIYPNPATESIIIEGAAIGSTLSLINSIGQQVLTTKVKGEKQSIKLSSLSAGIYIIRFTTKEGHEGSVRMMKE